MFNSSKKEQQQESTHSSNMIGKGTVVKGDIHTVGNIRIEGKVAGNIVAEAKVILGNTASVEGDISSQNCEIGGSVAGTIHVKELLILRATAVVRSDVVTPKLLIEEGAQFNGKCEMKAMEASKPISMCVQETIVSKQA
jgi:cytoskeletal protein CcmA (bactofilin family)